MVGSSTSTQQLPSGPSDLTPAWLTEALRSSGTIEGANVTSADVRVIGAGAGFMGHLAHVTLQYDRDEDGTPESLVAKLPAAHAENREVAGFFRFYEREVRFYEEVAHEIELRTPRCYFSRYDPESGNYALLIEDLAPAHVGDQLAGCNVEHADLCLRELAKLHAAWWQRPELDRMQWMPGIDADWYRAAVEDSYRKAWPAFAQVFGDQLSPAVRDVAERFADHVGDVMLHLGSEPRTIAHGDYRLDNLFFGDDGSLAVVDWQITTRARGVFDLAYFTCGTLPPEERKRGEQELLKRYHGMLTERGISGYNFEQAFEDYRLSALLCIVYAVIGIGSLDLANERGVELFTTIARRVASAIEDLDAGDLLKR